MPRFGSVCDDKVWRVPKLTSFSIVAFMRAWLTGATIARSFVSVAGLADAAVETRAADATTSFFMPGR
jgi:hypothetical protein